MKKELTNYTILKNYPINKKDTEIENWKEFLDEEFYLELTDLFNEIYSTN